MNHLLPKEQAVLDALAKAWNEFVGLDVLNDDDLAEFRHGIHALQNMVMARPVRVAMKRQAAAERLATRCAGIHGADDEPAGFKLCQWGDGGKIIRHNECCVCGGSGIDHTRGGKPCDGIPF